MPIKQGHLDYGFIDSLPLADNLTAPDGDPARLVWEGLQ